MRWSLSHPCASVCICGSKILACFLACRTPPRGSPNTTRKPDKKPMHQNRASRPAPAASGDAKTPCTNSRLAWRAQRSGAGRPPDGTGTETGAAVAHFGNLRHRRDAPRVPYPTTAGPRANRLKRPRCRTRRFRPGDPATVALGLIRLFRPTDSVTAAMGRQVTFKLTHYRIEGSLQGQQNSCPVCIPP